MTRIELATLLESYASQVIRLPGVSRTNPHAFAEAKSELAGAMKRQAKDLRTVGSDDGLARVGRIRPGVRAIGRRDIPVELRRRRA